MISSSLITLESARTQSRQDQQAKLVTDAAGRERWFYGREAEEVRRAEKAKDERDAT